MFNFGERQLPFEKYIFFIIKLKGFFVFDSRLPSPGLSPITPISSGGLRGRTLDTTMCRDMNWGGEQGFVHPHHDAEHPKSDCKGLCHGHVCVHN